MKVQKDNIVKEINDDSLLADYMAAGWKPYVEKQKIEPKPPVAKTKSSIFVKGKK